MLDESIGYNPKGWKGLFEGLVIAHTMIAVN